MLHVRPGHPNNTIPFCSTVPRSDNPIWLSCVRPPERLVHNQWDYDNHKGLSLRGYYAISIELATNLSARIG